jgi:hypothetical protein
MAFVASNKRRVPTSSRPESTGWEIKWSTDYSLGYPANLLKNIGPLSFNLWWGETCVHLARRPLFHLLYQPRAIVYEECGGVSGMRIGRGNRSSWRKPAPVPLCSSQIPQDRTLTGTSSAAVENLRLTALTMARPCIRSTLNSTNATSFRAIWPRSLP